LCPIAATPIIIGIGLNYRHHAEEAGVGRPLVFKSIEHSSLYTQFSIPGYPVVFNKYADALAGPFEDIPINKEAKHLDFEVCVKIHSTSNVLKLRRASFVL
jgi:2-keto-4-pentenoate hydratase/2-oxohepta-3-ene-1,7-dioic acid hydratase in catechol pathway